MIPAIPLLFLMAATPEQRAVEYLSREVARWPAENHCFSCHNNGDAVRALTLASRSGYSVPDSVLAETYKWLARPAEWEKSKGNPGFSDTKLATIQFAAAAVEARISPIAGAETLLPLQEENGSWYIETGGMPGAPAIYGTALATYMARKTLESADAKRFESAIARADGWFASQTPRNTIDAAALLLARPKSQVSLEIILQSQTSDGGWGPTRGAPAEAFDTALVLLALDAAGIREPIARGRAFLLGIQQAAGGWPETTRPSGQISYAEHISTTGWVLYALLTTGAKGN